MDRCKELSDFFVTPGHALHTTQSITAAQIFHDTAGWRNLETSMKCLEYIIKGCGDKFIPFIDGELLEVIFTTLQHTNRFVRETGFTVCAALVSCGVTEGDVPAQGNPMIVYGDQLARQLSLGLADNWSQVPYYIEATEADNHAVREAACECIAELALKIPAQSVRPHVTALLKALKICFNDDSWPVRDGVANQPSESSKYSDLDKGPAAYGVVKQKRDNDIDLHSDKQMYSCGSLAPKMGRGGCSDCRFRRASQEWEKADGSIYLIGELSALPELNNEIECENALCSAAAGQCINFLNQFLGPNILRGRVEEFNPSYIKYLDSNSYRIPK
ncbi:hypothetical protein Anas_09508 [Armadillidium nasatum]|uniref:Uncharacterized protein n=1 Tax=Armadillidium nasatum TaxID=96803 RepID=A0A5N5TCW0_9CRUS|nr:hypothetical protein Anas_09508 [Armadillidium nasatum]